MSRTKNSMMNIVISLGGQVILLFFSFLSRSVFINMLSEEYLGINGLFSSILNMLSLAELGVGTAITYSLYKPIAKNDERKIKSLMKFFKQTYIAIGSVVLILGLALTPFLEVFIKKMPDIPNLKLFYVIYLLNTAVSYFYAYKRTLISANQKAYIATAYNQIFTIIRNVAQIMLLWTTRNFLFYLLAQIVCTVLENIAISRKADAMFPYIKENCSEKLDKETLGEIKRNTLATIFRKTSAVVVMGTDNLLISKFVGIAEVGVYSNYFMITNSLNVIINQVFGALTASVGNLGVLEDSERTREIFKSTFLMGFWISGFITICLYNLFNPFITLWIGREYLFSTEVVLVIVFNFYIIGMKSTANTFIEALGLYWYDRYKPIFESIINLVVSLIMVRYLGVAGVFIGTAISTITTCFWFEPYILYKYGFKSPVNEYFVRYIGYSLVMLAAGWVTWMLCGLVTGVQLFSFLIKMLICAIVPNVLFLIAFYNTKEFQFLLGKLPQKFRILKH